MQNRDLQNKKDIRPLNNEYTQLMIELENFFQERQKKEAAARLQLTNAINEFYTVQKNFHDKIKSILDAFQAEMQQLSVEKYALMDFLSPYKILAAIIFPTATGDYEKDLEMIGKLLHPQHAQFKNTLWAIQNIICNMDGFNQLLNNLQQNTPLIEKIKQHTGEKSWLSIEGHLNSPFQNLFHYETLLTTIRKSLEKVRPFVKKEDLEQIDKIIVNVKNQIVNINDNKETITSLNDIERILKELVTEVIDSQVCIKPDCTYDDDQKRLDVLILNVLLILDCGRKKIINGEQNINSLLRGLLDLITEVKERYEAEVNSTLRAKFKRVNSYASSLGASVQSFGSSLLFNSTQTKNTTQSAYEKLVKTIDDLKTTLNDAEMWAEAFDATRTRKMGMN